MAINRAGIVKRCIRKILFTFIAITVCLAVNGQYEKVRPRSTEVKTADNGYWLFANTEGKLPQKNSEKSNQTVENAQVPPATDARTELPTTDNVQSVSKGTTESEGAAVTSQLLPTTSVPIIVTDEKTEAPKVTTTVVTTKADTEFRKIKGRHKGSRVESSTAAEITTASGVTTKGPNQDCTPAAYHEFPPDLFSHEQRARGAVLVHIAVIMYMFYAVAVVCDDYFIASLEECCSKLQLSEDVAGATFMAAGSSTPELFTAILGVLVAKGDVGTGTIVGSAVFNVLFVIGICGIFAGRIVELTWWPLFRDSVFYSFTVFILIIIIFDSEVTWYESLIMMCIYSLYILLMKFSNDIHMWISRRFGFEDDAASKGILDQGEKKHYSSYMPFDNEVDDLASMPVRFHQQRPSADESIRDNKTPRLSLYDAALQILMKRNFPPITRFRAGVRRVMLEHERRKTQDREQARRGNNLQTQVSLDATDGIKSKPKSINIGLTSDSDWRTLPSREDGLCSIIKWCITSPLLAVLHFTIPDCREERLKRFFLLTFLMSITWTAVFSYVMVWMVTLVGYTFGIPDSIMGITFLAAGTSVPDAFASLIVARQGQGDMAVSNSIGSNVFDILIGLAFPWFIQTAFVEPGSIATINSRGMVYSVILLFLTIMVTIIGIYVNHWQLTKRLGYVLLVVYGLFLILSILLEYNVMGYVNPPMCPD